MRVRSVSVLLLALSAVCATPAAHAQIGIITTVAGGGPNNLPATAANLAAPGSVVVDTSGNLYITDPTNSRVVRIDASTGILTTIAGNGFFGTSGDGGPAVNATLNQASGIALDSLGNLFISEANGNRIRKIDTTGTITTVAGTGSAGFSGDNGPGNSATLNSPGAMVVDGAGNLFIADVGNYRIRRLDAGTGVITTVAGNGSYAFSGDGGLATNAGTSTYGVAIDSAGDLFIADAQNNLIRRVDAQTQFISTVAGNGAYGYVQDGVAATATSLSSPYSVAVDSAGNLFIPEWGSNRVRRVDAATTLISTIAGTGVSGFAGDGGPALNAMFKNPSAITVDSSGNLFVSDYNNYRVRKVDSTNTINTVAGNGTLYFSGEGVNGVDGTLNFPGDVAVDQSGNVFIADTNNNRIRRLDAVTGNMTTVAGNGVKGYGGDGAAATSANLNSPYGLTIDNQGNLFIADYGNNRVRKVDGTGTITTVAGNGNYGYNGDGVAATAASIDSPSGVAVDSAGNLYVADSGNRRVRRVDAVSGLITTFAGNGTIGFSGDGGTATSAQFSYPWGVTLDTAGNLFVADYGNDRIRRVDAVTNVMTTVAGDGTEGYTGDSVLATSSGLNYPAKVAIDAGGDFYIADLHNQRVRKVDVITGLISTVAGNGSTSYGGDGGPATSASLANPFGVALDVTGNLFIADSSNRRVRRVPLGVPGVVISPASLSFGSISLGIASAPQVITFANSGNANLEIGTVTSSAADFTAVSSCSGPVAPGGNCTVSVTFTPQAVGARSGSLAITDNVLLAGHTVSLSGTGIPVPQAVLSPSPLVFSPAQIVNTSSAPQNITLTNTGGAALNLSGIAVSGDFAQTNTCGASVAAGSNCMISVTFTPTANGTRNGTLSITDNAPNSPQIVMLSGTGKSLLSIAVTPANASIAAGTALQFAATGTYSDGSVQDVTASVSWNSSVLSFAVISNAGLASALAPGQTVIQAGSGAVVGLATLTITPGFVLTGSLGTSRQGQTATLLSNGKVLIAGGNSSNSSGGYPGPSELYDPSSGTFSFTGSLQTARYNHTATLLNNGTVLIAGGYTCSTTACFPIASAELFDPATGIFTATGSMTKWRYYHTATLLNNGMVLIAGGFAAATAASGEISTSAELYDPATGTFAPSGSMNAGRYLHSASRLNNGMVLIAGGEGVSGPQTSAELYNPVSGIFTMTGGLSNARSVHTATLLNNGKVLVAGGYGVGGVNNTLASAELYDPTTGNFTTTGSLSGARYHHTATLLNNGKVLIAGGYYQNAPTFFVLAIAELYDPGTGTFTTTGSLNTARSVHTATLLNSGMVLIAGGATFVSGQGVVLASAELYEPGPLTPPNLVSITVTPSASTISLATAQHFTATGTFSDNSVQTLSSVTWSSANTAIATVTSDSTNLGAAYGVASGSTTISACAGAVCGAATLTVGPPAFAQTGSLATARRGHTSTVLNNGQVLITGGFNNNFVSSAELYDPVAGTFAGTGSLNTARYVHTATLLNNGKVLIVGGFNLSATLTSAELYDPATGIFTLTGSMTNPRTGHTATLLADGKVLIAGGGIGGSATGTTATAEIYDPATGVFTVTGSMTVPRDTQTATLLNNGKVLIAGGEDNQVPLSSAEIYDPVAGTFTAVNSMSVAREEQTATLLNSGKVLMAGGYNGSAVPAAELFDPATNTFTVTSIMAVPRFQHTATLLTNGQVLLAGGEVGVPPTATAELYDPIAGTFLETTSLFTPRRLHTASLLGNGNVLLVGGFDDPSTLDSAELYTPPVLNLPNLVSIALMPATPDVLLGTSQIFVATGTFADNSTQALKSVIWSSSTPGVATITNDATNQGSATSLAVGMTTISACDGSVCGSTTLTAGLPNASLSSGSVAFGNQIVATNSASQTITLSNTGTGPLTIFSITPGGTNSADFSVTSTCPLSPATLAEGANCPINASFSPSAAGARSGSITILNNSTNNQPVITMTGTGVPPAFPVPLISQPLVPSVAAPGGAAFTLTVNGSGFIPTSVVSWNGSARSTTFVNVSQLTAQITAADIAAAGTNSITVFNPAPGGGTSNTAFFQASTPVSTVTIVRNDVSLATNAVPVSVAAADLNLDTKQDLAVVDNANRVVSVLFGNGDGTFKAHVDYAVGTDPRSVAIADVNGDGIPDLIVANYGDSTVSVLLGGANGIFGAASTFATGMNPAYVATGDFNGDGKIDLAVATNTGISILLGNGSGMFPTHADYPTGTGSTGIAVGDWNGDGRPDLAVANNTQGLISVLTLNPDGTLGTESNYVAAGAFSVASGDLNGDGALDLVVTSETLNEVLVYFGNGQGQFQGPVTYATGLGARGVIVADLNSDGIPDLAVANNTDSTVSVLLGSATTAGTFQAAVNYPTAPNPVSLAAADFNGDGHLDLAVDGSTNVVSILSQAPIASTTTLASSPNPSSYGQSVTFTATVTVGSGTPAGTVTFKDGTTTIGSASVVSGQATISVSLSVGSHSVTASYSGDPHGHGASTSSALSQTVKVQSTSTTLISSASSVTYGQSVTLTATVTPQFAPATGSITFLDGTASLATVALNGNSASLSLTTLMVGTHSLTAKYSGDLNSATSTSAAVSQSISKATSATTLVSSSNPAIVTQPVTFTATVAPQFAGVPTSTVTFKSGATTLATVSLANGQASFTTSALSLGTKSITAAYSGDSNFTASTSAALSQVISKASTTTTVVASANPIFVGQSVTFTATIASSIGAPPNSEVVTFKDGATTLGTGRLSAGTASFTAAALSAGSHNIKAVYGGDTTFAASTSAAVSEVVNKYATSARVTSSLNPSAFGQAVTFTATVTPTGPFALTGTVAFKSGSTTLATVTISGGAASYTTSSLTAGTKSITAVYSGDANNAGSTSPVLSQTVNPATTTTTLGSSPNPSTFGSVVTLTATVTSGGGTPSGTVTFKRGATVIGRATLNALGIATITTSTLPRGNDALTATYGGSANFASSTGQTSQTVN